MAVSAVSSTLLCLAFWGLHGVTGTGGHSSYHHYLKLVPTCLETVVCFEPLAHRGVSLLTVWALTVLVALFEVSAFFFPAPFKLMSPSGATRSPAILRRFTVTEIKWRGHGIKLPGRVVCLLQLVVVIQTNSSHNSLLTNCKLLDLFSFISIFWSVAHFQSTIDCFHFYTWNFII